MIFRILFCTISLLLISISTWAKPTKPGALTVIETGSTFIEFNWPVANGNGDVLYIVLRDNVYRGYTNGRSFRDTDLKNNESYHYTVRAMDSTNALSSARVAKLTAGSYTEQESSFKHIEAALTARPDKPRATINQTNLIQLKWSHPAGRNNHTRYLIYRNNNLVGVTEKTTFNDRSVKVGSRYLYQIQTTNWVNKTALSSGLKIINKATSGNSNQKLPVSGLWDLEWSDEFNGPAGQKPGFPWHFDETWDGKSKNHRQALNTNTHAYLDGNSNLKMEAVIRDGRVETSMIRSSDFQKGDKTMSGPPANLLLDPRSGPLFIETSVRLDKAYKSEDAWWAFWLMSPNTYNKNTNEKWSPFSAPDIPRLDPYDGNAQRGMEVDIFEYVPYLGSSPYETRNGFNMAAFIKNSMSPAHSKHIDNDNNGFVADINDHLRGSAPAINLVDGKYHKIGMYWDDNKYEFFIGGTKVWTITDPNFITRSRANALVLSWEVENGIWGDKASKTFLSEGRSVYTLVDYVRVYRKK